MLLGVVAIILGIIFKGQNVAYMVGLAFAEGYVIRLLGISRDWNFSVQPFGHVSEAGRSPVQTVFAEHARSA